MASLNYKEPQRTLVSRTSSPGGYLQAGTLAKSSANSSGGTWDSSFCPCCLGWGLGTQESPGSGWVSGRIPRHWLRTAHSTEDHRVNRAAGNLIPQKTSLQPFRIREISWKNRLTPPPHALPHCISLLAVHRRKEWFSRLGPEYEGNAACGHSTWRKCLNEVGILEGAFPQPQGPAAAQGCFLVSETKLTVYVKEPCLVAHRPDNYFFAYLFVLGLNPGLAHANWALIVRDVPTSLLPLFFGYPTDLTPAHTFCCLTLPSWLYSSTTLLCGSHCCRASWCCQRGETRESSDA